MNQSIWRFQEAKNKLSQVIDRALTQGVQIITSREGKTVVVLSYDDYARLTRQGETLSQFFLSSPLAGSEINTGRDESQPRG